MGKPILELRRGRLPSAKAAATVSSMGFSLLLVMGVPNKGQAWRDGFQEPRGLRDDLQPLGQVDGSPFCDDFIQTGGKDQLAALCDGFMFHGVMLSALCARQPGPPPDPQVRVVARC